MACEIEGCPDAVWARGWCQKRYYRWYRTGDPLKARPKLPDHSVCSVKGCNRPNEANGYCQMHRWRVRMTGDPGTSEAKRIKSPKPPKVCVVEGYERRASSRFKGEGPYCRLHYERQRRGLPIGPPGLLIAPKGAGTDHDGTGASEPETGVALSSMSTSWSKISVAAYALARTSTT
jgi:hypothetical protein